MPAVARCKTCGADIDAYATQGFCTACLLESGLSSAAERTAQSGPISSLGSFGQYELLAEIARGGMGIVYKARQRNLDRVVALKMILTGHLASVTEVKRFLTEARTAATLQHPNIVAIHEVSECDGQHFFSMDYVEGQNLAQLVRDNPLPPTRAARYVKIVAEAVHYAHERGILHRDLKPSNVLIDANDQPRITDFGLAKRLSNSELQTPNSELTLTGQLLGSPNFMPPEQAVGKHSDLTPAADVYSLGALLYHLLSGRPPFLADSIPATLRLVAETEPTSPRLLVPTIPLDLETICLKCLEKDAHGRYGTARELADELNRFLSDEPIRARPIGRSEKFKRWTRRHPVIAALTAIIGLLLIAVAAISTTAAGRLQRANREGQEKLREAYLSQARANRWSGRPGRRFDSLEAIRKAVAIRPGPDLRDEAIAAMALVDVRLAKEWEAPFSMPMAFDARCERYAQGDTNGNVMVRRVQDDAEIVRFPGLGIPVHSLRFSPNGRLLSVHYRIDGTSFDFKIYDLQIPGRLRLHFPGHSVRAVDFSADSRMLALALRGLEPRQFTRICFFDLDSGNETGSFRVDKLPWSVAFHPDASRLAISSVETTKVHIYSVPEGERLQTLVHSSPVHSLSWDASGQRLAAAVTDGNIHLWDLSSDPPALALLPHEHELMTAYFHPRGDLLMSFAWDHLARLWNSHTGKEVLQLPSDQTGEFSQDGRWISIYPVPERAALAEVALAEECHTYYFAKTLHGARRTAHSRDGRWLASAGKDGLRLTDTVSGSGCHLPDLGDTRHLQFTPDGQALVTAGDGGIQSWPIQSREENGITRIEVGPPVALSHEQPESVDPANRMLSVAGSKAYIFDSKSLRIERRLVTREGVFEGALSPDGRFAVTSERPNNIVNVWNAADGRSLASLGRHQNPCLLFSPDGRWLVTGTSEEYRFRETESWSIRKTLPRGVTGGSFGRVAFTPDGKMVTLAMGRGDVGLYDTDRFELLATLQHPETVPVSDLDFSPDGGHLVVSVGAPFVYRWDLRLLRRGLAELKLDFNGPPCSPLPPSAGPIHFDILGLLGRVGTDRASLRVPPSDLPRGAPQINLTAFYNASLTNSWWNAKWVDNDLSQLPQGLQMMDGVAFDIRGVIQLAATNVGLTFSYPKEVGKIPVQQKCKALHFIHGTGWVFKDDADVGEYVIHYEDGTERLVPLTYAENIWAWWCAPGQIPSTKPGTTVGWRGGNPMAARAGKDVVLLHFRWENPLPTLAIASITFRSRMTPCAPFLVAITAE